jgi:hypothetical protein
MKKKIDNLNKTVLMKNTGKPPKNRLLVGTPSLGTVRMEWATARWGACIPCNWSAITITEFMSSIVPMDYQIADAYNLICKTAVEQNVEWLLTIESDNILPSDAFIKINNYMLDGDIPVVSALYFTKSEPAEPLIYRGLGNSYFDKWKFGDKIWVDGCPMGLLLIHSSIIRAMWNESPEYIVNGITTRRIFETPNTVKIDPETGGLNTNTGTQDLAWCKRLIDGKFLEKAGWSDFSKKHPVYPILIDTNLYCRHISSDGIQFPINIPQKFIPEKDYKGREIIK